MNLDILQQEDMIKEMASKQIDSLITDLTASFETLAHKEKVEPKDIQLAVRYDTEAMSKFIEKQILDIVAKEKLTTDKIQLAVRFQEIENGNGDCNFYYQVFKEWKPVTTKQWLDDIKKAALENYLVAKLGFLTEEPYSVSNWVNVSIIFHIQKEALKMSIYVNENGKAVHKKSFAFTGEEIKDMSFIYFQILKEWKPLRLANFSKDFLNADTIMKDEREDLIRLYLAGGKIGIPGMAEPLSMPGNLDVVAEKYKLQWKDIAFVFCKETNEAKPQLGIYGIGKKNIDVSVPATSENAPFSGAIITDEEIKTEGISPMPYAKPVKDSNEFLLMETVDIFSLNN